MKKAISTLVLGGILSTACSTPTKLDSNVSGSTYKQAKAALPKQWQAPHTYHATQQQLTKLFNTPALNTLVRKALTQNINLQQTALRLKEQGLLVKQSRAARLPNVSSTLNRTRSGNNAAVNTQYNLGVTANWEIDLWGKLANQEQASRYEQQATKADYEAAKRSLAAQVIRHWISLATQKQVIQLEQQRLQRLQRIAKSANTHFSAGNRNFAALSAARSNIAQTQATLLQRKETLKTTQRALNVLLGQVPTAVLNTPTHLPQIRVPTARIPSEVIGSRLDVQAAFARLQAADKNTQVAYKQLLPTISLTPSINQQSAFRQLLSGDAAWQLVSQLTGTLFDGGQKRTNVAIQKSATQRAALTYRQTLLTALSEVENALSQESSYTQQLQALAQTYHQARQSQAAYQAQYQQGQASLSDFVNAENATFNARISQLETQRQQLENRINLALALGMGI